MGRRWLWIVPGLLLLGYIGWRVSPAGLIYTHRWENEGDYERRRDRYEAILAALGGLKIPDGQIAHFYVDAERNPDSLRRLKVEELNDERFDFIKTGRYLQVSRTSDGSLVAVFYNKDLGPFGGIFGTIHSVSPPSATLGLQGIFKKVAPNWWAGHFD
jgi:hypothetical protein